MRYFSHHVWLPLAFMRVIVCFFLISYFTVNKLHILVNDIILVYIMLVMTTFRVSNAFAFFIAEYFSKGFDGRTERSPWYVKRIFR